MSEASSELSLANPQIQAALRREYPKDYDAFVHQLHIDIDAAVNTTQASRQYTHEYNEDQLTISIVNSLKALSYYAEHDPAHGGHVDIYVKKGEFIWLGEAKIYSDNGYVMDGFYQLCTRYSNGAPNESKGGLVIYINDHRQTASTMQGWETALLRQYQADPNFVGLTTTPCPLNPLCFVSTHTHEISGLPYSVRHVAVNVSFRPRDGENRPNMPRGKVKPD